MSVQSACVTRRFLERSGWLSVALLSLAMLAGLPPEAKAENSQELSAPIMVPEVEIGEEEGSTITFNVSRTGDSSQALTVNYETLNGEHQKAYKNAKFPGDFTKTSGILTFAANEIGPKPITVQTTQDTVYEAKEEEFILRLSGTYNDKAFSVDAKGIIEEDDRVTLTLTPHPINITEGETQTLTFELSEPVPHVVRIGINDVDHSNPHRTATRNVNDGGATMADYTWSFQEVIIQAKATTGTINITANDDMVAEPDEIFELDFTSYNRPYGEILPADYHRVNFKNSNNFSQLSTVTIKDDDKPSQGQRIVYLHGGNQRTQVELEEGASTTVTATLVGEAPMNDAIVIPLETTVYPTEDGWNNFVAPTNITIAAGKKSGSATLTTTKSPTDDRHYVLLAVEINETKLPNGYEKGDRSRFEVVIEDITPTKVQLRASNLFSLSEDPLMNNKATFEIEMSRPVKDMPSGTAPFSYNVVEPDPKFVLDFTGKASHKSDFDVGAITGKILTTKDCKSWDKRTCTVELTVVDDDLYETTETAKISLNRAASENNIPHITTSGKVELTINDNDMQPMLSVDNMTITEGGKLVFEVERKGATENTLSVQVATANDDRVGAKPAMADSDYRPLAEMLEFANGILKETFEVATVEDVLDEPDETFLVKLSKPKDTGGNPDPAIAVGTATGTITDNDDAPSGITLTASPDSVTENGGAKTITVTAAVNGATRYAQARTVSVSVGGGTAISGTDYTAVESFDIIIGAGVASVTHDFTLTPTDDDLYEEGNETIDITGTSNALTITKASITLEDNDAQPSFAVADASASEGDAITFTVTRSGAMDNAVSVKWNTKTDTSDGANDASATDYTEMSTATKLDFAKGVGTQTFTVATTEDVLHEGDETFLVELTEAVGGIISDTEATGTITDDDAAPSGITLSVDTNGATEGTPSTVAEDAGATVVTVTATVNGTTRYVDAKTVVVSVADDTAASPADYAAVTNFNITIAAGAASHTGSFTVTPVDDDLDETNETIDVTGTVTDITITGTTVTLNDNDDPVSFSIADAEATEGGKVTFTVSRGGAEDNVASVKVATAADSGDGVNAAGTDDYTAIATAQTLSFAKGVTSQTVEVQTTQDDLFEPDETFKAVLSDAALGDGDPGTGVSIESGKGTAIGTIKNDDTQPSFAVADASAAEGDMITFTVTRSGAMDNVVSVKWNTKAATGAGAASTSDYTPATTATKLDFAKGVGTQTFTVATTEDVLHEGDETFLVELTEPAGAIISDAQATGTITDDDAAPSGITLSVDTNGSTSGTPSTVAEDAGATVVTVTATVNGETRYVDAKTVAVSVADGTAASPADYAAVSGFNITIAAGAASHTGSFTVTPVDDDLDEADETIDVTGTLSGVTVADATVTLTDTDDPVSFSIADAEATEGGKVTFTVSRAGAEDNVAEVKVATAADSGDGVKAADTDDYTAIATAQTLNFAKGVTSQTVEVQTTQDDLFEPDETFKAVLSDAALGDGDPGTGVSIESGKGTAIGTIKNDDTQPSFAVANASASEGDAITFTVTRSGAMDNAVSVKWNTKADSGDGANAASTTDYTAVPTARTLTFAKGEGTQTFTVATTEDNLHEGDETFLVELTDAEGATIATAEATGTITDDDAAPSGITLTVSPSAVGERDGETEITVTATVNGTTRYVDAKTVTVSVGGGSATSDTDYDAVASFDITIAAGDASKAGTFDLTPTDDDLHEGNETIDVTGTSNALTITKASLTLTDDDTQPSFAVADASASEGDVITFTVTRSGAMDNVVSVKWNTRAATGAGAASTSDYTENTTATQLDFAKGEGSQTFTVATTEDTLNEANETFLIELTEPVGATITDAQATGTITNDDAAPTTLTLVIDADNDTENVQSSLAENGGAKTVKVTATLGGSTQFDVDKTVTLIVGDDDDSATEGTDYTDVADVTLTIPAGDQDVEHTFTLTPTNDAFNEASETISFDATLDGVTVIGASIMLTSDDDAPAITLTVDADKDTDNVQTSVAEDGGVKTVRVTATLDGTTRLEEAADLTLAVGKSSDTAVEGTDYTNIADRTITIGAGVASVTDDFTLTPTNDDLYEGSETISLDGTLTGVAVTDTSLTLTDDDTQPSFAVADASAAEGDAITFTVTRSGAMDNAVSVKWNTKAATGAGSASTSDYSEMTTATKLDFAKGVGTQTFTVATTEDVLHEGNETFLVELTEPAGAIISDAQATGTITDDDAAPSGITLSVDTNGSTSGTPSTVAEDAGATVVTVTATVNGETRYVDAKTVAVSVADGTAASPADYAAVSGFNITIAAGAASHTGSFTVTPVDDDLDEADETIDVTGTLSGVTVADATVTLTDTDDPVSFSIADAEATEGGKVTFTVSRAGAEDNVAEVKVATAADSGDGVKAADTDDYTAIATAQTLNFAKGVTSQTVEVQTTQDDLFEPDETFRAVLSAPALGENDPGTGVSIEAGKGTAIGTIKNDDTQPSFAVADASASEGDDHLYGDPFRRHGQRGVGEVEHQGGLRRWGKCGFDHRLHRGADGADTDLRQGRGHSDLHGRHHRGQSSRGRRDLPGGVNRCGGRYDRHSGGHRHHHRRRCGAIGANAVGGRGYEHSRYANNHRGRRRREDGAGDGNAGRRFNLHRGEDSDTGSGRDRRQCDRRDGLRRGHDQEHHDQCGHIERLCGLHAHADR